MDPDFWRARWRENRIGFHQAKVNRHLQQHRPRMRGGKPGTVLVPLAGKSRDLGWLAAQGDRVIGVELVESAVKAFFEEQGVEAERRKRTGGVCYEGAGVAFWAANFFEFSKRATGPIDWIYDRAALIALPEAMRVKYVERKSRFLAKGGEILLVTIEHEARLGGPPFSILGADVEKLYAPTYTIESLDRSLVAPESPRFREAGIEQVAEVAYRLVKVA